MKSRFAHAMVLSALTIGFFFFSRQAKLQFANLSYGYTLIGLDLEQLNGNGDFVIPDYQRLSSTLGEEFTPNTDFRQFLWEHYGDNHWTIGFYIFHFVVQWCLVLLTAWGWVIVWREWRGTR